MCRYKHSLEVHDVLYKAVQLHAHANPSGKMTCRCHPIAPTATHQVKYFDNSLWNSIIIIT